MSITAIVAIPAYLVVAFLCIRAARAPVRKRNKTTVRGTWLTAAGTFAAMAVMRLLDIENSLRTVLRVQLRMSDLYDTRRDVQVWIAVAIVVVGLLLAGLAWKTRPRSFRDRRAAAVWTARWAVFGFAVLILLRLTSFSVTDRILFGGPVHLNWLLDGGMTLAVAVAALVFARPEAPRHGR